VTTIDDPFALAEDSKVARRPLDLSGGRYRFPRRDGTHKPYGWQRVTNLVGAYSDSFGLRLWEIEQVLRALGDPGHPLVSELWDAMPAFVELEKDARKEWVEAFTEKCKAATKADAGTRFGNHRHSMVEEHHEGLPQGHQQANARRHLALYAAALIRNRLRAVEGMQERRVLIEAVEAVGTLDNVLEDLDTGRFHIGDLKTQKRFWTWLEIKAQLATYANSDAVWNAEKLCWEDWPVKVDRSRGAVVWMPREHPSGEPAVDVYRVDLISGWRTALRAYEVVQDRAAAKSKRNNGAELWPAPVATATERYAARFAAVDTMAEGRVLVAEAKTAGVWSQVLADCAGDAVKRLTGTKNLVS
jgi:hypothetical protein